jgi:GT2 family glycosyltransferase
MSLPHVAIVILNYNGSRLLHQFLPFTQQLTYPDYQVYVVDNASTDDSLHYVNLNCPWVNIIRHKANYGFAKGYNEALKQIKADYYLILNTDVEISAGILEPLVAILDAENTAAICQPKILSYSSRSHFEYAGAAGGMMDRLGYPFARGRIFFTCEADEQQYDGITEIFWASGACMLVKASYFHQVSGFYEYFFMQSEETDLCWRIKSIGGKVLFTPHATVFHVGGANLAYGSTTKNYLNFRNNWIMMYRNMPRNYFYRQILTKRLLLDLCAALYFLCRLKPGYCFTVFKAIFHFLIWWKNHGQQTDSANTLNFFNLKGVYKGSIVMDYFVRNKKRYQDL